MKAFLKNSFLISFLLVCKVATAQINIATSSPTFIYNGNSVTKPAHTLTWQDATNNPRSAVMIDQTSSGSGYLAQFTYTVNGVNRVCQGTGANGAETYGDGFVQNHTANGGDSESTWKPGTTTLPLQGNHHAIVQYNIPNYTISDPVNGGGNVPTAIQWFFATGRDYPIYSITQDARLLAGNIGGDSRSPYGDMHYDGSSPANGAWGGDLIGGISMGDTKKWVSVVNGTTNESTQITSNSGWNYSEPNTIPYAMQWTKNVNAEQGHVQTQPISIKDAGRNDNYGTQSAFPSQQLNGPMIGDEQWMFQIAAYGILNANGGVTKRLTWGTNFGAIGGFNEWWMDASSYKDFRKHADDSRTTGNKGMFLAYSIWDVFGTHTGGYKGGSVGKMVTQMENIQLATLTASIGTVISSGPAGIQGIGATFTTVPTTNYVPTGYNHIYATWEANATNNLATVTLTPTVNKPIEKPVFVINNYNLSTINPIKIDGIVGTPNVDYFTSLDTTTHKLWITVNKTATSALQLQVTANLGTDNSNYDTPSVTIYPNPSNGEFKIDTSEEISSTEVYDFLGKKIKIVTNNSIISIKEAQAGIYLLKIFFKNNNIIICKVIKN